ncbi:LOW QUALITY PROTEIN: hypothetical protein ACHAWF_005804 [Thalassiosira exigua]
MELRSDTMEKAGAFVTRLLTWLLASFVAQVVVIYYMNVRVKACEMIQGLSSFVDILSVIVDYKSPRSTELLNDLYGSVRAIAHYAFAHAAANTQFRLSRDEIQAIFDENGYDGKYMLSHHKKQTVKIMCLAILRSIEEEMESEQSCIKNYCPPRQEGLRADLRNFSVGAMSVISCVSSNKLPYAYVQFIAWATKDFLLAEIFLSYVSFGLENVEHDMVFTCFDSSFSSLDIRNLGCVTDDFIFFNVIQIFATYVLLGCLELYPTLVKSWSSQLVVKNYTLVVDLVCEPLRPDVYGQPKNLSQLKNNDEVCGEKLESD